MNSDKNIKQDMDVDAELGIAEENYNEFWKDKKEECEEDKEKSGDIVKGSNDSDTEKDTEINNKKEDEKVIKQDADVDAELGIAEENYNKFWEDKKQECEEDKEKK